MDALRTQYHGSVLWQSAFLILFGTGLRPFAGAGTSGHLNFGRSLSLRTREIEQFASFPPGSKVIRTIDEVLEVMVPASFGMMIKRAVRTA